MNVALIDVDSHNFPNLCLRKFRAGGALLLGDNNEVVGGGSGMRSSVDVTILKNDLIPPHWECPHCGSINETYETANDILFEHFKVLQQCRDCGYSHCWKLQLTEEFKRKVVKMLIEGSL